MKYSDRLREDEVAIYLFHGVVEDHLYRIRNYTRKHIDKKTFETVLDDLCRNGSPVSMEMVLEAAQGGRPLPPRAFAITFDDGFANNLHVAAPLLQERNLPATFYLTTDFINRNVMVWIDRIEWALEQVSTGSLQIKRGSRSFSTDRERVALLEEVRVMIKSDPKADGNALADDIQRQLGFVLTYSSNDPLDRKLSWDEVVRLKNHPNFMIAGHSHKHRILSYLNDEELENDITTSIRHLRERAGIASHHYAYPEGLQYCYSGKVIDVLKRHGIACCPSAIDGTNSLPADPFHLRRIFVI